MLEIQKYLQTHTLQELQDEHGIYASYSSKYPYKHSFNYDQIESKNSDTLCHECRGLILYTPSLASLSYQDYKTKIVGDTQIIAFPMKRFFNYGQEEANIVNIDDPNIKYMEKLDGTLIIVNYDFIADKWCVATRSVPEADIELTSDGNLTFASLFAKAISVISNSKYSFEEYVLSLDKNYTYNHELMTPYNENVCRYSAYDIAFICRRNIHSHQEDELFTNDFIRKVSVLKLSTFQDMIDYVAKIDPTKEEGTVVMDSNGNRMKVKNADWVAYSKIKDKFGFNDRNCMQLILSGKEDDVIPHCPDDIANHINELKNSLNDSVRKQIEVYNKITSLVQAGDSKGFALLVQADSKVYSPLFYQLFSGKAKSFSDFVNNSQKDNHWSNQFLDRMLKLSKGQ